MIETATLRARLAAAALDFARTAANQTGQTREDLAPWATHLQQNRSELFGADEPEPLDSAGPTITWAAPAAGQAFTSGAII